MHLNVGHFAGCKDMKLRCRLGKQIGEVCHVLSLTLTLSRVSKLMENEILDPWKCKASL